MSTVTTAVAVAEFPPLVAVAVTVLSPSRRAVRVVCHVVAVG